MKNEYQGMILNDCHGHFFRHHTLNKSKAKDSLGGSVMQLVTSLLHDEFLQHLGDLWYKQSA